MSLCFHHYIVHYIMDIMHTLHYIVHSPRTERRMGASRRLAARCGALRQVTQARGNKLLTCVPSGSLAQLERRVQRSADAHATRPPARALPRPQRPNQGRIRAHHTQPGARAAWDRQRSRPSPPAMGELPRPPWDSHRVVAGLCTRISSSRRAPRKAIALREVRGTPLPTPNSPEVDVWAWSGWGCPPSAC